MRFNSSHICTPQLPSIALLFLKAHVTKKSFTSNWWSDSGHQANTANLNLRLGKRSRLQGTNLVRIRIFLTRKLPHGDTRTDIVSGGLIRSDSRNRELWAPTVRAVAPPQFPSRKKWRETSFSFSSRSRRRKRQLLGALVGLRIWDI